MQSDDGGEGGGGLGEGQGEGEGGFKRGGVGDVGRGEGGCGTGGGFDVVDEGLAGLADADDGARRGLGEKVFEGGEVDVFVVAADEEDGGARGEGVEGGDGGVGGGGFGVVEVAGGCGPEWPHHWHARVCERVGGGGRGRRSFGWLGGRLRG